MIREWGKWLHHKENSVPLVGVFGSVSKIDFLLLVGLGLVPSRFNPIGPISIVLVPGQ